jgi:2-dehydro-3-deoxygluconokinase
MGRVVCFGELLIRLTGTRGELLLQSGRLDAHIGGAEANVAVGLASLGYGSAMVSCVPNDVLGDAAVGHLRRHGVDTAGVLRGPGRMGLYFLSPGAGVRPASIIYDREASSFALAGPDVFDWERLLDGADMLHLSGITPALGPASADAALAAADTARSLGVRVSFDGNYREQLWRKNAADPANVLRELLTRADIFFGNHRDIALLLGRDFGGDGEARRREAALAALEAFPNLQLIASTARHIDPSSTHRISARIDTRDGEVQTEEVILADIVDRIGAGDAFAVGLLHGLLTGRDHGVSARYGLSLACLKHGLSGDACPFSQADIDRFLAGERDVQR